jgi:hypothetical protein
MVTSLYINHCHLYGHDARFSINVLQIESDVMQNCIPI